MVNIIDLLKELYRKIKKISDEKFDVASLQNICDEKSLPFEIWNEEHGTLGSVILVGNQLRFYFSIPYDALSGVIAEGGNFTNEYIGSSFDGYGRSSILKKYINKSIYGGRINSGSTGGILSIYADIKVIDPVDDSLFVSIDLYGSASHQAIPTTNGYFTLNTALDITKY